MEALCDTLFHRMLPQVVPLTSEEVGENFAGASELANEFIKKLLGKLDWGSAKDTPL